MKKLSALILSIVLAAICLCGCGGEKAEITDDTKQAVSSTEEQAEVSTEDQEKEEAKSSGDDFLTYEDLPQRETMWIDLDHCMVVDMPYTCESYGSSVSTKGYVSLEYYYIAACAPEMELGADLEETFLTFLNSEEDGGFHRVLKASDKATYDDMVPEIEHVTLDTGKEAIKFSGIQHKDDYGTLYDCPIYGYATMCGDVPAIVCYLIVKPDEFDESNLDEMVHIVDEMVNTLRIEEW